MLRVMLLVLASPLLVSAGGCGFLIGLVDPPLTTVRLDNNADFNVDVVLYYDNEQDAPRDVLTEVGTRMEFTLTPGQSVSFDRDCDELQAVVIDNAELVVIGQIGPEAGSEVQRDGSDFNCRDTVVFTFDHSALLLDFAVSVSVEKSQ
jgi:hypothetical protein